MAFNPVVESSHGKRRLEAYSLVEEADDETHLVPQSPPSALSLGAETLRFEEEQSRSGQYEAERGNNTSPVKFLGFLTSVQNCSELFSFSRILEKTKKRRWREFLLLVGLTHLTPPDAT